LFNLPGFPRLGQELMKVHPDGCGSKCCQSSMYALFLNTQRYVIINLPLLIGPICSIRAIIMMLQDYKYSRPSQKISPTPILTALAGTQTFVINEY
jgi:hypothetical protein